ncbi:unnamed protein product [Lasius platythorax]|uniref:Uncharacterized protein n=1 Tax=Lasius platythorax TaxID=488582 RepID=A0AAV2PE81_9HYME
MQRRCCCNIPAGEHNEWLLLQRAFSRRHIRAVVTPAIGLPIGTHSDDLAAFYGYILAPRIEKSTTSTRGIFTVNSSRAWAPPPGEEGRERYLRHADSA